MKPPPINPKFQHPVLHRLESLLLLLHNKTTPSPSTKTISKFKQILSQFITTGLSLHTYPLSRLLSLSSSLSLPSYSLSLLSRSPPSTFLFNTLISSSSTRKHAGLALSLYARLLLTHPLSPNPHTYPSLLKACGSPRWAPHGLALHAHATVLGFHRDPFVLASLLNFYRKRGKIQVARQMFDEIHRPDLAAWNSILSACSRCSYAETLLLFRRMLEDSRVKPNEITLVAVVSACGDLGALAQGFWAHSYILRGGAHSYILRGGCLSINRFVGTSLIEMYSKCGRLGFAEQVFGELSKRDVTCYNAMIRGFAIHGFGHRAIGLFERMITEGARVDEVTVLVLMSACAHSGLVDEGRDLFNRMQKDFGIEPKEEHYGCLIDLLGRAGELKEAENVVREMSIKPTAAVYRSLLGACRVHGNIELGERLIARVMQLDPDYGGNYVLQSNLYADTCRWDDVGRVRKVMKAKRIDKTPGVSSIEMDGVVHEFVMGDKGHPRCGDIYDMLDEIGRTLCEYGHRMRAKEALFVVE